MWWLIAVGIILIGISVYGIFLMKKKTDTEESANPLEDVGDGVNWFTGWRRQGRINNETAIREADTRRKTAKAGNIAAENEVLAAKEAQDRFRTEADYLRELSESRQQTNLGAEKDKQLELEMRENLFRVAAERGMDITTYLQITSSRELKAIDLQARAEEYRQDQEQISRVQQEKLELVDRATHRLFSMYEQRAEIQSSNDPAKDDKLRMLNHNIEIGERLIRGEQDRYLQAALGEEAERALPPAQSGGDDSETGQTDRKQLSAKRGRGRPRKTPAE